jgi:EmrB/QacA subfamily drug resistance transporter
MGTHIKAEKHPWFLVAFVSLAVIFTALDQTVIVTVLPELMFDLELGATQLDEASWIITAYLIGYTAAIPFASRLADVFGYAVIFRLCLLIFAIGSIFVAIAPNLESIVVSRFIQAVGGGGLIPISLAIVTKRLPKHRRLLAIGIIGASAEIGLVLGPIYGGIITELLGWRWLFWLDVPQTMIILFGIWHIPGKRNHTAKMDYRGGFLLTGSLILLTATLSHPGLFDLSSTTPLFTGIAGLFVISIFIWNQKRVTQPLLPRILFQTISSLASMSTKLLLGASLIIAMVTVPLMAETIHGESILSGGLRLVRLTGAIPIGALLGGLLSQKLGARKVIITGLAISATALFFMSQWGLLISDPQMSINLVFAGFGFGLVIAPLFFVVIETCPDDYKATAASIITLSRMVGMALGLAALSAWGMEHFIQLTGHLELPLPITGESSFALAIRQERYIDILNHASVTLFQHFFRISASLVLIAIIPSLLITTPKITDGKILRKLS